MTHTDDDRIYLDTLRIACDMPPALSPAAYAIRRYGVNSYEALSITETSVEFLELMHHRLMVGGLRYGRIRQAGKVQYDRIESMVMRLKYYELTGNQEHLVDVANLALLEFMEPNHPDTHWNPVDDGEHTKETR